MAGDEFRQPSWKEREIDGRRILFDGDDFFEDPDDWNDAAALALAKESGLHQLNEAHWRVIHFLREYYHYNGRAPLNKNLKNGIGMSVRQIESLFPGGIKYGARRIAGLPNPKSCV